MPPVTTVLSDKMDELAKTHPRGDELRERAQKFRQAAAEYITDTPTISAQQFLGAWARARRLWCDCTGEPLVGGLP